MNARDREKTIRTPAPAKAVVSLSLMSARGKTTARARAAVAAQTGSTTAKGKAAAGTSPLKTKFGRRLETNSSRAWPKRKRKSDPRPRQPADRLVGKSPV